MVKGEGGAQICAQTANVFALQSLDRGHGLDSETLQNHRNQFPVTSRPRRYKNAQKRGTLLRYGPYEDNLGSIYKRFKTQ